MKKLLALGFAVAATLTATAAVSMKVAPVSELNAVAAKVGALTSNPMVGMYLAGSLQKLPQFVASEEHVAFDESLKGGVIAKVTVEGSDLDQYFENSWRYDIKRMSGLVENITLTLKLGDKGLDLLADAELKAGVAEKYFGTVSHDEAKLRKVNSDAVLFSVGADKMKTSQAERATVVLDSAKEALGLDFLAIRELDGTLDVEIEAQKYVDFLMHLNENKKVAEFDMCEWMKSLKLDMTEAEAAKPGTVFSMSLKGYKPAKNAVDRFYATLPEMKGKALKGAAFYSLYGIAKTLMPVIISQLDDPDMKTTLAMLMMQLPQEGEAGIAAAIEGEGDKISLIYRLSNDEIRSISGAANTVFMMAMMNGGFGGADETDGDIDDEDLEIED